MLPLAISCKSGTQKKESELTVVNTIKADTKDQSNIRFNFSVKPLNNVKEIIEIKASIFNDNTDTVYFLSSTCNGEQYALRYDTTKFELTPFINCNASFPRIMKIAPKGQYDFRAQFRCNSTEHKIKLGFDFYAVNKSFDLTKMSLADIHNRKIQTIIWADEKTIN